MCVPRRPVRRRVEGAVEQVREPATRSFPLAIRDCTIAKKQVEGVRKARV